MATVDRSKDRKIGLWAEFLEIFGLGGKLSVQYDKSQVETYSFTRMKTEWFLPSKEFVEKRVKSTEVAEFLDQMDYKVPVYIITGLKTVEGASVTSTKSKGRTFHAKLGLDGTSVAAPVTIGPEGDYSTKESETVTFTNSTPIVFAFQLSKVSWKEKKGATMKEYTKGALFGVDKDYEELDNYDLEQTLEQGEGKNFVSVADEDDEAMCLCILPELELLSSERD